LTPFLDERTRRLVAAAEAKALGFRQITLVSNATGVSRRAIRVAMAELEGGPGEGSPVRVRRAGGGRKATAEKDPTLKRDLEQLIEPMARGDPESPLRWTCKSVRVLAQELNRKGHKASKDVVADVLHDLGYSLQTNKKTIDPASGHPERNDQFEHIYEEVNAHIETGDPVISVDTKKKELVGNFKNAGRELNPRGHPEEVRIHDFLVPELGRANPYGVYDLARNEGWVSVGTDHDTATFAVQTIRRWWATMGKTAYPNAKRLLITADGGGSNGYRLRLWKLELQGLADEIGIPITVCHFPPGTSKWNKIEHRLFSFISQNWRGKPLLSHEVMVSLIAATTTKTGLKVRCELDSEKYPAGRKVSNAELSHVHIVRGDFHGEWNYTIVPSNGGGPSGQPAAEAIL